MHHFIVRERQDEILVVMVKHRERQIVLIGTGDGPGRA